MNNLSNKKIDMNNVPPFVDSVMQCDSWEDLCSKILPPHDYQVNKRATNLPSVFNDPVTCRLYDALYRGARESYARNIASEYWNHIAQLSDGETIFEIGCGPGLILLHLAQIADEYGKKINFVGCDISPEMIYLANEHISNNQIKNVSFFISNSKNKRRLLSSLKKTKLLISRNVLSWMNDPDSDISFWQTYLPEGANWITREVRRDLPLNQFKRRLATTCHFSIDGQLLAYPVDAFLIAYLRAFTEKEHHTLLKMHFNTVKALPIISSLTSDLGKTEAAESQFICTKEYK